MLFQSTNPDGSASACWAGPQSPGDACGSATPLPAQPVLAFPAPSACAMSWCCSTKPWCLFPPSLLAEAGWRRQVSLRRPLSCKPQGRSNTPSPDTTSAGACKGPTACGSTLQRDSQPCLPPQPSPCRHLCCAAASLQGWPCPC